MYTAWNMQERRLRTSYDNKDFHRAVTYAIPSPGVPVGYANGRIFFELELEPGQEWQACGELGLSGYAPLSQAGANINLIIPNTYIDPISASVPHRSRMCRVTKERSSPGLSPIEN